MGQEPEQEAMAAYGLPLFGSRPGEPWDAFTLSRVYSAMWYIGYTYLGLAVIRFDIPADLGRIADNMIDPTVGDGTVKIRLTMTGHANRDELTQMESWLAEGLRSYIALGKFPPIIVVVEITQVDDVSGVPQEGWVLARSEL